MAGSFADIFEVDVLKAVLGQATTVLTTTPAASVYLSLHTGAAAADGPGTEATGGSYARKECKASWGTPAAGTVSNTGAITFTTFTGAVSASAAITHFALSFASSGTNYTYWGDLTDATKVFGNGDTASFPIGSLVLNLT